MADPLDEYAPSSLAHSFADQYLNESRESATPYAGSMKVHPPEFGEELGNLSSRLFGDERLRNRPAEIAPALGILAEGVGALPRGAMSVERAVSHLPERDYAESENFRRLLGQIDRGEGATGSPASADAQIVERLRGQPPRSVTPSLHEVNAVNRHGRAAMNAPQGQRFGVHQARQANAAFNEDRPWLTSPRYEDTMRPIGPEDYARYGIRPPRYDRHGMQQWDEPGSRLSRWIRNGATAGFWGGLGALGYLGEQGFQEWRRRRREDEGKAFDPKTHAFPNEPFYEPPPGYDEGQAFRSREGEAPRTQPMPLSESYSREASEHATHRNDIPGTAAEIAAVGLAPYMAGRNIPRAWKYARNAFAIPTVGFASTAPIAYMENDKRAQAARQAAEFWIHAGEKTGLPEGPDINVERQGKAPGGPVGDPLDEYRPSTLGATYADEYLNGPRESEMPHTGSIESRDISPLSHPDEWLKQKYGERVGGTLAMPYETGADLGAGVRFGDEDRLRKGLTGALQLGLGVGMGMTGPPNFPRVPNTVRTGIEQTVTPAMLHELVRQGIVSPSVFEELAEPNATGGYRYTSGNQTFIRSPTGETHQLPTSRERELVRENLLRSATVNPAVGMPMVREIARRSNTLPSDVERFLRNEEVDGPAFDRISGVVYESDAPLTPRPEDEFRREAEDWSRDYSSRIQEAARARDLRARGSSPPTSVPEVLPPKGEEQFGHFVPMRTVTSGEPGQGIESQSLMDRLLTLRRPRRYERLPMDMRLRSAEETSLYPGRMSAEPPDVPENDYGGISGSWRDPETFQIHGSQLPTTHQGSGQGMAMYQRLIDEAFKRGAKQVYSDYQLSPYSRQIYPALERRGYRVTKDPLVRDNGYWWYGQNNRSHPGIFKVEPPLPLDDPRTFGPGGVVTSGHQPLAADEDDEVYHPFWSSQGIPGYTSGRARADAHDYLMQEQRRRAEAQADQEIQELRATLFGPGRFAEPRIQPSWQPTADPAAPSKDI